MDIESWTNTNATSYGHDVKMLEGFLIRILLEFPNKGDMLRQLIDLESKIPYRTFR